MALIASNGFGGGNFSAGASWAGGVVPALGDEAQIVAGDTITIDVGFTVGGDNPAVPAMDVLNGGTLDWDNFGSDTCTFRGHFYVRAGGTLTLDGTATLANVLTIQLNDSAALADNKYHLRCYTGSIINITGFDKTRTHDSIAIGAAAAGNTVSTGNDNSAIWNVNDYICVSGSFNQSERQQIAGFVAAQITIVGNWANNHGTVYRVGNLTRNIRFEPINANFETYIYIDTRIPASTWSWCEFADMNYIDPDENVTIDSCSFWTTNGVLGGLTSGRALDLDDCVFYNCGRVVEHTGAYDFSMDGCFICHWPAGAPFLAAVYKSGGMVAGSLTSNYAHDGANGAFFIRSVSQITHSNNEVRDLNSGAAFRFRDCFAFDVTTSVVDTVPTVLWFHTGNAKINVIDMTATNVTVADLTTDNYVDVLVQDSVLTGAGVVAVTSPGSRVHIDHVTNINAGHITHTPQGTYELQNIVVRSGTYAMLMSPSSATDPLIAESTVPASNGVQVVVSAYFRKNPAHGAAALPFLRLSGAGVTTSTDVMTDIDDTWELLVVSGTPTRDGFCKVEFVCQSAGVGAACYVDDVLMVYTSINTGGFDYWFEGDVAPVMMATGLGALDVWAPLFANLTVPNSIGLRLATNVDAAISSRATQADILNDATPFAGADIDQSLSTTESNIRGADGDDLKDISDQVDATALEANVQAHTAAALNAYDPPTHAEMTAGFAALNDLSLADIQTMIIEGVLTLQQALRILLAFSAGTTTGANTTNPVFKSQDGGTDRIDMTVNTDGERSAVTVDGT